MNQQGQATILVLGLTMVVFGVVGIAVDGTKVFIARRTLQSSADAAALAGAGELDTVRYYRTGGRAVALSPEAAAASARRWLALRGLSAKAAVEVSGRRVMVTLRADVPTLFLRVVGVDRLPVAAQAVSSPGTVP